MHECIGRISRFEPVEIVEDADLRRLAEAAIIEDPSLQPGSDPESITRQLQQTVEGCPLLPGPLNAFTDLKRARYSHSLARMFKYLAVVIY